MVDPLAETLDRKSLPRRASEALETRLVVVHPPPLARVIPLTGAPLVLGRGTLADGTVSRQHAEVRWELGRHVVVDLDSRNGTAVNATPLAPRSAAPLDDNFVVALGDVLMVYERGPVEAGDAPTVSRTAVPGDALATRALRARLEQAGSDPAPALLIGETGVGKELSARELHRLSARRGAFVAVNVAELTHELAESQLFGHEKGAFTGADRAQPGLFRAADGGTLFLDEIGELPLELQPKLLRVLQEREVRPVGQTRAVKVDVRVVAATHRDVRALVESDKFRRDLYARLAFWEIDVPSLARRRADIPMWIDTLLAAFAARRGARAPKLLFDAGALELMLVNAWPENLRGLDRIVHRLAPLGHVSRDRVEPLLTAPSPPTKERAAAARVSGTGLPPAPKRPAPTTAEELERALAEHGSVRAVAKHYGRDRRQVYRWLEQLGLRVAPEHDDEG